MPVADTMEAEEVVEDELWRDTWREMVPNWDMGMGPKPGPWGTAVETGATVGGGGGGKKRGVKKNKTLGGGGGGGGG